jgi:hypothetical protein
MCYPAHRSTQGKEDKSTVARQIKQPGKGYQGKINIWAQVRELPDFVGN